MNRSTVVGIVVASVLVLGVGGAVTAVSLAQGPAEVSGAETPAAAEASSTSDTDSDEVDEVVSDEDAAEAAGDGTAAETPGAYVDYSEDALAAATGQRVLFFHADWCPSCRALDADIEREGVPAGITVLKVDYDSNQALRQKYAVTVQTTLVALDDAGEATGLFVPYESLTLSAALDGLQLR